MVLFFLVAFGMPWLGWSSIHFFGMTEPSPLRTALFYTGDFCSIGGFVAIYAQSGKAGVIDLLKRCVRFNVPVIWWIIAIGVPFLITFIAYYLVFVDIEADEVSVMSLVVKAVIVLVFIAVLGKNLKRDPIDQ